MHWVSPTPVEPVSVNSVLAGSIQEPLEILTQSGAQGIPVPRCHCLVLYQIHCLPRNCCCCHLEYPCCHSSGANFWCPKHYQVCYTHYFWLDDCWFFWFGGHFIFEFVLQRGSFADNAGGKGDLSDHLKAATPSCWKSVQVAMTISGVFEMYPAAVICVYCMQVFFCVARRFWLPCHIPKKLWTLAILFNFHSSASFFVSEWISVFVVSTAGSLCAKIMLLTSANCPKKTFSWRVSPVGFDYLQRIASCRKENLASTPIPSGMIEHMLSATLEISAYLEWVSSCWRHQSVRSRILNALLLSSGLEW